MHPTRSSPKEVALLKKIACLPVNTHQARQVRQFDFSRYPVLCWIHGVKRGGRRYRIECNVVEDGSLDVVFTTMLNLRRSRSIVRMR